MNTAKQLKEVLRELSLLDGKAAFNEQQCKYLLQRCLTLKSVVRYADENPHLYSTSTSAFEHLHTALVDCKSFCMKYTDVTWLTGAQWEYTDEDAFLYQHQTLNEAIKEFDRDDEFSSLLLDVKKFEQACKLDRASIVDQISTLLYTSQLEEPYLANITTGEKLNFLVEKWRAMKHLKAAPAMAPSPVPAIDQSQLVWQPDNPSSLVGKGSGSEVHRGRYQNQP